MNNCIFCKIARHELPSNAIYENEDVFAFHDINPQAPTHVVIIPKAHIENLAATTDDHSALLARLLRSAAAIAERLDVARSGYRVVVNNGPDGGQSVDHLHVHLLAGRPLAWPPG